MKALLQRVSRASVTVDEQVVGQIGQGLLVLLGVGQDDSEVQVKTLADKIAHLRIFGDDEGKMNRSLLDIGGEVLVISQFTLYANTRRGRRPSFTGSATLSTREFHAHQCKQSLYHWSEESRQSQPPVEEPGDDIPYKVAVACNDR